MRVILFRHGLAEDRALFSLENKIDALRPLVPKGQQRTLAMTKLLKKLIKEADLIASSDFLRATQTAEIIANVIPLTSKGPSNKNYLQKTALRPQARPSALAAWLNSLESSIQTVILVGHEPCLGKFASWCLAGTNRSFINLKKSGILALEFQKSSPRQTKQIMAEVGQLLWLLGPKALRGSIGESRH